MKLTWFVDRGAITDTWSSGRPAFVQDSFDASTSVDTDAFAVFPRLLRVSLPAAYLDVVAKTTVQSWRDQRDAMWETAIRRWHSSIMTWSGGDRVVRIMQDEPDFRGQCQIIVDIMHNKAPSTLLKRCNSLSRLVNWLNENGSSFP